MNWGNGGATDPCNARQRHSLRPFVARRPSPSSPTPGLGEEVHCRGDLSITARRKVGDHALVVRKRIAGDSSIECFGWIAVLRKRTEVEDVVLVLMSCIKKALYVATRVSI